MADNNQIPAYPFMFDQSQWSNKYSPFAGKAIPFPAQYRGTPTDALGRPIQSYTDAQAQHDAWAQANPAPAMAPAVTLNSPSSGARFPTGSPLDQMQKSGASPAQMQGAFSQLSPTIGGQTNPNYAPSLMAMMGGGVGGAGGAQQAQPAPQTNPIDMNQAYLDALARPGKVTTPGATVPQSAPPSNQSGVLNQFLANWNKGGQQTAGAGNYNNRGFFDALQGQV